MANDRRPNTPVLLKKKLMIDHPKGMSKLTFWKTLDRLRVLMNNTPMERIGQIFEMPKIS
jgi:hypothetical protein